MFFNGITRMVTSWGFCVSSTSMRFWTSANLVFGADTMSRLEVLSGQMRTCCEDDCAAPPAGGGGPPPPPPPPGGCGPIPGGGCGPGPGDGDDFPEDPALADCAPKIRVTRFPNSSASAYFRE